jgi:hypothetical protein
MANLCFFDASCSSLFVCVLKLTPQTSQAKRPFVLAFSSRVCTHVHVQATSCRFSLQATVCHPVLMENPDKCFWCERLNMSYRTYEIEGVRQLLCSNCRTLFTKAEGQRLRQLPEIPLIKCIQADDPSFDATLKGIMTTTKIVSGELVCYYAGVALSRTDPLFDSMDPRYFVSCVGSHEKIANFVSDGRFFSRFPVCDVQGLTQCDVYGPGINHSHKPNCKFAKYDPIIFEDSIGIACCTKRLA